MLMPRIASPSSRVAVRLAAALVRAAARRTDVAGFPALLHTASGLNARFRPVMNGVGLEPLPAAIWAMVRPDATERSFLSMSACAFARAHLSRCLMSSQLVREPPKR